ncbi:MAG: hypothetical protein E7069_00870 [Bacteroidales bacterium]|jgi:hypothetical protein|nr:hypothetical protein [Bacteroidales bacterium]
MCTQFESIKKSYRRIGKITNDTVAQDINKYLDSVLELSKFLNTYIEDTNKLISFTRENFTELTDTQAQYIEKALVSIEVGMKAIYYDIRNSRQYKGMRSLVEKFNDCIADVEELRFDVKEWRIEAPQDGNFQAILNQLDNAII